MDRFQGIIKNTEEYYNLTEDEVWLSKDIGIPQ